MWGRAHGAADERTILAIGIQPRSSLDQVFGWDLGDRMPYRGMGVKLQSRFKDLKGLAWLVCGGGIDIQGGWATKHVATPQFHLFLALSNWGLCATGSQRLLGPRREPKKVENEQTLALSVLINTNPSCPEPPDHPQKFVFAN